MVILNIFIPRITPPKDPADILRIDKTRLNTIDTYPILPQLTRQLLGPNRNCSLGDS